MWKSSDQGLFDCLLGILERLILCSLLPFKEAVNPPALNRRPLKFSPSGVLSSPLPTEDAILISRCSPNSHVFSALSRVITAKRNLCGNANGMLNGREKSNDKLTRVNPITTRQLGPYFDASVEKLEFSLRIKTSRDQRRQDIRAGSLALTLICTNSPRATEKCN